MERCHPNTITLQCKLRVAERRIADFESGEAYRKLEELRSRDCRDYENRINKLEKALSQAHAETITVRNQWFQVFEDIEKERCIEKKAFNTILKARDRRILQVERQRDKLQDDLTNMRRRFAKVMELLEEAEEKNKKLLAQANKSYENSSIPSSKSLTSKKIPNSREKTGKKPGAQLGHEHHGRKKQIPTQTIHLAPPEEVIADPDFRKTTNEIVKQLVSICISIECTEFHADVYYNPKTNEYIHAEFPHGVVDDVNYDGKIKAFLYLLNNECCVSADKCSRFLQEISGGKLKISKGMINQLGASFAEKSKSELEEVFSNMLTAPVMHTDCTNARVNGESAYVYICAVPEGEALYFSRDKKGHEGVKGTVTEDYQGILVHDHETTFYKYGSNHQECLAHVLRYLKGSIENEPELTWNKEMRELLQRMIHYRNSLADDSKPDPETVAGMKKEYTEILRKAKQEYKENPPGKYYRDGYNLYKRMSKDQKNYTLFLDDKRVPATNNLSERLLRKYKRKQKQAVSFRSHKSISDLCDGMSMLLVMRKKGNENVFEELAKKFDR